jgi:serine/threonine protein kinase
VADESYRAERVREILTAALTQPPGERATFVRAAANDAQIAAEVLALLRHMRLAMRDATNSTPAAESTDVGQRSQSVAMSEKGRETADASTLLKRGFLLSGRYRIKREIGRGGMGAVYEAVDERLHNIVAVKQMLATANRRAFEREARLLAALRHSGLPVVIDYFTEGDAHYLVMQYIDGEDLHHRFERLDGSLQEHDVVSWAIATLDVLVYLHSRTPPIVHRDIKPANIKVTPSGAIVLLDFGLAKGRLDRDSREYSIFGYTPGYAPPEQVEGQGTDARSDLYALGATLFHLVTGVPPVGATSRLAAVAAGHPDPQPAAAQLNTNVSPMLSEVLRRATALDARLRFPSAADMREELSRSRAAPAPSAPEPASARRVDAAIPSHGKIGEQLDLIVQVRFADSRGRDWKTGQPGVHPRGSNRLPNPSGSSGRKIRGPERVCPLACGSG